MSTQTNTVISRSSVNFFTKGCPIRAVTFQSIERTSSPGWYSRKSSKSIPSPLKQLWYSPPKLSRTSPRVRNSILRTRRRISEISERECSVSESDFLRERGIGGLGMWNGMVFRLAIDFVWLMDFEKRDANPFHGF